VNRAATRSRWLELKRDLAAARRGRELLDEKREVLVREVLRARARADAARTRAAEKLAAARAALSEAEIEIGSAAAEAAGLAQLPAAPALDLAPRSFLGVALPALRARFPVFRALYAPGGTSGSLDNAARAYADLVPHLAALAEEELAVTNLHEALARTNRRWNALDRVLLPNLASEIRRVENDLDEEARDEAFRGRRRARARSPRRAAALSNP
jgi:V/A-type H+-transporting ATPase subunit D